MTQGINREKIFSNSKNIEKYIKIIEEKIDKDMECKKLIDEFLSEHSISKMQLLEKNNRKILKSMVEKFRNIYSISYRSIERNLGISRETLRKLNM